MAAPMRPIGRESQREFVGDGGLADYLEHGSCVREIADCAIDRAAAELNASSFKNAMALGRAMLVHWSLLPGRCQEEPYAGPVTPFLTSNLVTIAATFWWSPFRKPSLISTQRRLFSLGK
jgi:hypothetical protein